MNRNQAFPGKHLKAGDLGGVRVPVVVDHVGEEVVGSGQDAERKAVCYFRGKEKALVLNQTNWNMLEMITSQPDSDNWSGAKAILFESTTQFGGKTVPCLRLDPMPLGQQTARTVQAPPPPPPVRELGDDYTVNDSDVPF